MGVKVFLIPTTVSFQNICPMSISLTDLTPDFPAFDGKALALLKHVGVTNLVSFLSLPVERIAPLLGINFFKADKLKQSLIEQFCPAPRSGLSLFQVSHCSIKFQLT